MGPMQSTSTVSFTETKLEPLDIANVNHWLNAECGPFIQPLDHVVLLACFRKIAVYVHAPIQHTDGTFQLSQPKTESMKNFFWSHSPVLCDEEEIVHTDQFREKADHRTHSTAPQTPKFWIVMRIPCTWTLSQRTRKKGLKVWPNCSVSGLLESPPETCRTLTVQFVQVYRARLERTISCDFSRSYGYILIPE